MKRSFGTGMIAGLVVALTVIGLGVTALAASRSITVDDGIRIQVNQVAFTPRDSKGAEVAVFTYNGTTYVPMRALAEKLGFQVDYDAATRTAHVQATDAVSGATSTTTPGVADSALYIGEAKAKEAALKHAGVTAANATFVKSRLDYDDGHVIYEVEFYAGGKEYDYDIDALTGKVLQWDHDAEAYAPAQQGSYIGEARAKEIALAKAPGSTVVKCELDIDDGVARYELELRKGYVEYECEINAKNGDILKWSQD